MTTDNQTIENVDSYQIVDTAFQVAEHAALESMVNAWNDLQEAREFLEYCNKYFPTDKRETALIASGYISISELPNLEPDETEILLEPVSNLSIDYFHDLAKNVNQEVYSLMNLEKKSSDHQIKLYESGVARLDKLKKDQTSSLEILHGSNIDTLDKLDKSSRDTLDELKKYRINILDKFDKFRRDTLDELKKSRIDTLDKSDKSRKDTLDELKKSHTDILNKSDKSRRNTLDILKKSRRDTLDKLKKYHIDILDKSDKSRKDALDKLKKSHIDVLDKLDKSHKNKIMQLRHQTADAQKELIECRNSISETEKKIEWAIESLVLNGFLIIIGCVLGIFIGGYWGYLIIYIVFFWSPFPN